jgi:predicted O-methyltransferase YrrM
MGALQDAIAAGRPYFGEEMRANQLQALRARWFPHIISSVKGDCNNILEIGSWAGQSTCEWLKQAPGAFIVCVDPWVPYTTDPGQHYIDMNEAAKDDKMFNLFKHNIKASGFEDRVVIKRGTSMEVLPTLMDRYSIIFIDGDHIHPAPSIDIHMAWPLLAEGGIMCGDDLDKQFHEINPALHEQALGSGLDFVHSYHPGVTEAIRHKFGTVWMRDGFWAVRKINGTQGTI